MSKPYIPACYFPSTVLFVDDNKDFLNNLILQLDDKLAYLLNNSPKDALRVLQNTSKQADDFQRRCLSENLQASDGHPLANHNVSLNLASILWEVYNPQRFSEISVVIVDYAMPNMDGLEFCRKIRDSSARKILLTGMADENLAIQAFNEGIIDYYIRKHDPNIHQLLTEVIKAQQLGYFLDMSNTIIKMLSVSTPICMMDQEFSNFFKTLCDEHGFVEYYLTEISGSFLLLNSSGKASSLIVKNRDDLDLHYELAQDNNSPQVILEQLRKGEKVPYFWHQNGEIYSEWSEWSTCLYPAKQFQGQDTYYYALIQTPISFDIRPEKILPYNNYINKFNSDNCEISRMM